MDFENDADFEMVELEQAAAREARLRKRGICTHGWLMPVEIGKPAMRCNHCKQVFANSEAAYEARREVLA